MCPHFGLELGTRHTFSSVVLDYIMVRCANFRDRNQQIGPLSESSPFPPPGWLNVEPLSPGVFCESPPPLCKSPTSQDLDHSVNFLLEINQWPSFPWFLTRFLSRLIHIFWSFHSSNLASLFPSLLNVNHKLSLAFHVYESSGISQTFNIIGVRIMKLQLF